ncbi:hypothetical protein GFY24_29675 [Nocardia sp. SYP-A9097]|uniref:hypothetical protein n=1 Tax=Nocardia sp. SYP-A9097 TaxID=2663237 RepID=UPI00129B39B2|nr:hypothetical protein [Nocardia sp. SYP-A9097]MRH91561.1 hypothetical protein [Nocardia sp. SYP-A9097]
MNYDASSANSSRPPVLAHLHNAPTAQGLTIPYLTLCHRGRRSPVWGAIDPERYAVVLGLRLCQVCGEALGKGEGPGNQVVVFIRPQDWLRGIGPEPGLHPSCAAYSTRGCPMLAGRMPTYRSNAVAARITPCDDPGCECHQWTMPDPESTEAQRAGKPADPWYSALIDARDYEIIHVDGDESSPSGYGVRLREVPILRLRKVRGTPDNEPTVLDMVAAALDLNRLADGL